MDINDQTLYNDKNVSAMFSYANQFPDECEKAWKQIEDFSLPDAYRSVDKIVILGMGGSAIGGEMVKYLSELYSAVPIWICRGYTLPQFVDERTLVIASSYSGNTEETVSTFQQATGIHCPKLAITTAGKIGELAESQNIPVYRISYSAPPRAAFPHSFVPLLGIMAKLDIIPVRDVDILNAVDLLRNFAVSLGEKTPAAQNPAKTLAQRLENHLVVLYGAEFLTPVARRWKGQFNENSKTWSFYEEFPELNHNAVVGYEHPSAFGTGMSVVMLKSGLYHNRISLRYEATCKILEQAGIQYDIIQAKGTTALEQLLSLVLLGDYTSLYLSVLNNSDPVVIRTIDFIKGFLANPNTRES